MDLFKWSVPFLMEKVSDMFVHIVKQNAKLMIRDDEIDKVDLKTLLEEQANASNALFVDANDEKKKKLDALRAKVKVVARMNRILKTIK